MSKTALYRHYDAEGALLYVGISRNPFARLDQHMSTSPWASEIASVALEWFDDRTAALNAERAAISKEIPLYNARRDDGPMPVPPTAGWQGRLHAAIEGSGKSRRAISIEAGLAHGYVHSVLVDGKEPTVSRFLAICAAIPADPAQILGLNSKAGAA